MATSCMYRVLVRQRQLQLPRFRQPLQAPQRWHSSSSTDPKHTATNNQELSSPSSTQPQLTHKSSPTPRPIPPPIPGADAAASVLIRRPWWQRLGPLTRAAEAFGRSQQRRPYATQVCTTLAIYLCADLLAQAIGRSGAEEEETASEEAEGNVKKHDFVRTARSLVIGFVVAIPSYKWFMWLGTKFNYASRLRSLATKIAVHVSIFTPGFNIYFFGMQSLLSGDSPHEMWERLSLAVPVSVYNALKVWPATMALNFAYVPAEHRNTFALVVALGWQTYLAFLNKKAEMAVKAMEREEEEINAELNRELLEVEERGLEEEKKACVE